MKKLFCRKRTLTEDMNLQITSMADIFMILLVFLLKNYSVGLSSISPGKGISLPITGSQAAVKESTKLEVGQSHVVLDDKPILPLAHYEFKPKDITDSGESEKLTNALTNHKRQTGSESHLMLLADEKMPYSTLKTVLASAANAGFVDLQLVVVNGE